MKGAHSYDAGTSSYPEGVKGGKGQSKGKGKQAKGTKAGKGGKKGKKNSTSSSKGANTFRKFDEISRLGARKHYHPKDREAPFICYNFQKHGCDDPACQRLHICVGCVKPDTPYDDCGCLDAIL